MTLTRRRAFASFRFGLKKDIKRTLAHRGALAGSLLDGKKSIRRTLTSWGRAGRLPVRAYRKGRYVCKPVRGHPEHKAYVYALGEPWRALGWTHRKA